MRFLWIIPAVLCSQACVPYCVPYGYFDLQENEGVEVVAYSDQGDVSGSKRVGRFPSGYKINRDDYVLLVDLLTDRGYPTASMQVESKSEAELGVSVSGGGDCLRVIRSAWDGQAEIMWVTDNVSCRKSYPLEIKATDDAGHQVVTFNIDFVLRENGEKCQIDAP